MPTRSRAPHSLYFLLLLCALLLAGCGGGSEAVTPESPAAPGAPAGTPPPSGGTTTPPPTTGTGGGGSVATTVETFVSGVSVPWAIAFAPDGRVFFTEQRGRIRVASASGQLLGTVLDLTSITPGGEAGMLGLVVDPNFNSNHFLYVYHCVNTSSGVRCRISRVVESNNSGRVDRVLFELQGTSGNHNGGRLKIGPDGLLYLTTGDISEAQRAQNIADPHGKILRMTLDGQPASGNPFAESPFVWAYGFRNPQGLAWDTSGQLYATDHGPSSNDEVNIIHAGRNYGWPTCVGRCGNAAFVDPVRLYSPETAAPSGASFYTAAVIPQWTGSLFHATLGLSNNTFARHVHRIKFDRPGGTNIVEEERLFAGEFGRIRDVVQGPEGFLYFSTSNGGDDRILRVRPR